ncbi:MAG TPA: hypothetical protein VLI72_13480 [Methylibium sp.]|nr:hypothetical protein [Methylibium sp.]
MPAAPAPHLPRTVRAAAAVVTACLLAGCETIAITALGVGASAGVSHTANAITARTFTASNAQVRSASLTALGRMGIVVESIDSTKDGELIKARSVDRRIEVEIEPMSRTTTYVQARAKRNFFVYDAATAKEIILQTELALAPPPVAPTPAVAPARRGKVAAAMVVRTAGP